MHVSPPFLSLLSQQSQSWLEPELARAQYLPSIPRTRASLPNSSSRLTWPAARASSSRLSASKLISPVLTTSSAHLSGKRISCPVALALQKIKEYCGHFLPMLLVSHMTAPAAPLACSFCSVRHLPIQTPSAQVWVPGHGSHTSLLLQDLLPASIIEPPEFASSMLLFVHLAISPSRLLLPSTGWPE